ncbi:MAG: ABC transporter permease [Planctomycetota bacterium]
MISQIGRTINQNIESFGGQTIFLWETIAALFLGLRSWGRWDRLGEQLYTVGARSVPVLALTGLFIGAILAVEGYYQFKTFGQEHRLGGVVTISIVKQIGPVLAGVMLAGRVGCSLTAELGSMKVTEQIDAMRAMGADPMRVLVAPRVVACVVMIPALTVVSNAFGMAGSWLIVTQMHGVDHDAYWDFIAVFIDWFDVLSGQVKAIFFGAAIGVIACFKGLTCGAGARGVGQATTEAFVTSFVAIVVLSLGLAQILNTLDLWRQDLL